MTSRKTEALLVLAGQVLLGWVLYSCGGSRGEVPVSPTPVTPRIAASAAPVPLVATRGSAGTSSRYHVTAELSFSELTGREARITQLLVSVMAASGWTVAEVRATDLKIAAHGSATYTLNMALDASGAASSRWRLTTAAVTADGEVVTIAPVETDLRFSESTAPAPDEVFVGAGDIGQCGGGQAEATAALLDRIPGTVFTLGDNAQGTGSAEEYVNCYGPAWGRHLARTLPIAGNHDWDYTGGGPYFAYFGANAGPVGRGYYSFDVGAWHIIALNSEIAGAAGSPQYEWLKADLAASTADCTLAMWHRPLFSSGPNGGSPRMRDAWRLLNQHGAELVLSGHDHDYERFAPQDADGRAIATGIRAFVVGTGGYSLYWRASSAPNSEVFESRTWGVLRLTLKAASYAWEFVPVAGQSFRDAGSSACVAAPR